MGTSVDGGRCTGSCGAEWSTSLVDLEDVGGRRVVWLREHREVGVHFLVTDITVGDGPSVGPVVATCSSVGGGARKVGGVEVGSHGGTIWPEVARTISGVEVVGTSDTARSANGNSEWKELGSTVGLLVSETLVLSVSTAGSHVEVALHGSSEGRSGDIPTVLGWHGETTSDTVEDGDGSTALGEASSSGGLHVVVVLVLWVESDWRNGGHLWVVHHLGATSSDTDDLSEVGSLLDGAEEFFSDTLDWVEMGEVSILGGVPSVDVDGVERGVAVTSVTFVTTGSTADGVADPSVVRNGVVVKAPSVVAVLSSHNR